jgi:PTH1 family peptidyl-tRNA hydrolase
MRGMYENMYIIIGLGNPEPEYSNTRHNMGFDVINKLAGKHEISLNRTKFNAIYGTGIIEGEKVILIKPQTYMNNSGEAVKEFVNFYKEPLENVIVIYDDMDTDIGSIRVRAKGGPGSHNGMKSIVNNLNSEDFPRIRVGIGRPKDEFDRIDYVIGKIDDEEFVNLQNGQDLAVKAVEYWIKNGIDNTMNVYN